jgi:sulfotransferase
MSLQNVEISGKASGLTRFHFICGLPRSGAGLLEAMLRQNPRFLATSNGPAQKVFADLVHRYADGGEMADLLDDSQKVALWRNVIGAVYHRRSFDSVVFDQNLEWLPYVDLLVRLFPLSRFILCVRNPAAIVNSIEIRRPGNGEEEEQAAAIAALMDADGEVGSAITDMRDALSSHHAERMLVIDYDRLVDDPEDVMDVLYEFLREPAFAHDFDEIGDTRVGGFRGPIERTATPMMLSTRTILQLSGRAFWRNLRRTSATLMLGRSR